MADDRDTEILHASVDCKGDRRDCRWDQERHEVTRTLRRMESTLSDIRERLARGDGALDTLKGIPERLIRMEETVSTLRTIVYGATGLALLSVGGAILALILRKG